MRTLSSFANLTRAAIGVAVLLLGACTGALAEEALPRLHFVRVNDTSPEALAGARAYANLMESTCRLLLHMPPLETPLTDAQLSKIVFREEEDFYEGDRIAHFETWRLVIADSSSQCQPYVYVYRQAKLVDGCEALITGQSGVFLNGQEPAPAPPPWSPSTQVMPGQCATPRRERHTEGVPADDAGAGLKCVWDSRLQFANMGQALRSRMPAPESGNGPPSKGFDVCLWQQMPDYRPPQARSEGIILRMHTPPEPDAHKREVGLELTGGHVFFGGNGRVRTFEKDGASGGARLTKAGVEAFVRLSPKEAVPPR